MTVDISRIKVGKRIRNDVPNLDAMVADMEANGLITAITVTAADGDEFRLIAGLRRLRAAQMLGWTEIAVNVVTPADADTALRMEYSENEQREPFTFSEKEKYRQIFAEIESAKARERKSIGGKGGFSEDMHPECISSKGTTRNIVAAKIGVGVNTYDRMNYISQNAPQEVIDQLDRGERSINATYDELRAAKKVNSNAGKQPEPLPEPQPEPSRRGRKPSQQPVKRQLPKWLVKLGESEEIRLQKLREWDALPAEEKVVRLEEQLKEQKHQTFLAQNELHDYKQRTDNQIIHSQGTIELLQSQRTKLETALAEARARIAELEAQLKEDTE